METSTASSARLTFDTLSVNGEDQFYALDALEIASLLADGSQDLIGCMRNCSNNGKCVLLSNKKLNCICREFYMGTKCEISWNKCDDVNYCLNGGECNLNRTSNEFYCKCPKDREGVHCELEIEFCKSEKCSSNGYCVQNGTRTYCKCFIYHFGDRCEYESFELTQIKRVITVSSIIAIISIVVFYFLFIASDILDFCCKKDNFKKKKKRTESKVKLSRYERFLYVN